MPDNYIQYDEKDLQSPEQREDALRDLYKRVFYDGADFALNNPEDTLDGRTPLDYCKDSIENFRKIEMIVTSYPTSQIAPPQLEQ
mgnify:FL=1